MNLQNLIMFMSVISMVSVTSLTLIVGADTFNISSNVAKSRRGAECSLDSAPVSSHNDCNIPIHLPILLADDSVSNSPI